MRRAQTAATMSLALGVVCALLASCSSRNANDTSQSNSGSSTAVTNSKTINIAEIVFLSGPVSTFGQELDKGAQIAIAQINAAGGIKGKKLVVTKCDTESTTPKAVACAGSALSSDASAIIAYSGTDDQLSWVPDAQKAGMPVLSNSIADQVPAIGNEVMQVVPPDADLIPSFISTLKAKLGLKTVAFLHDTDSAASVASYQAFKSAVAAAGLKVVADQGYLQTDTTWSSQLLNIKSAHPDAIIEVPYAAEGGSVLIQARQLGLKQPIFGGSSLNSPAALQQGVGRCECLRSGFLVAAGHLDVQHLLRESLQGGVRHGAGPVRCDRLQRGSAPRPDPAGLGQPQLAGRQHQGPGRGHLVALRRLRYDGRGPLAGLPDPGCPEVLRRSVRALRDGQADPVGRPYEASDCECGIALRSARCGVRSRFAGKRSPRPGLSALLLCGS